MPIGMRQRTGLIRPMGRVPPVVAEGVPQPESRCIRDRSRLLGGCGAVSRTCAAENRCALLVLAVLGGCGAVSRTRAAENGWWRFLARPLAFRRHSGEWRNWQTRWLQVPVIARSWGFKSPLAHQMAPLRRGRFASGERSCGTGRPWRSTVPPVAASLRTSSPRTARAVRCCVVGEQVGTGSDLHAARRHGGEVMVGSENGVRDRWDEVDDTSGGVAWQRWTSDRSAP